MIGVFTYRAPHRKTYDTLCLLRARGYEDVVVFAQPLHYVKKFVPLIEHRPQCYNDVHPEQLCKNVGYKYVYQKTNCRDESIIQDLSLNGLPTNAIILVCGAGIIPQTIVQHYKVINAHPGYIPNVRGLDALKWAIYEEQPIGVTTHQIGSDVDAGLIIERRIVPVYYNDTFHAVAYRQYEIEIKMLVDAIEKINEATEYVGPGDSQIHKRMPHELETEIPRRFEKIKEKLLSANN